MKQTNPCLQKKSVNEIDVYTFLPGWMDLKSDDEVQQEGRHFDVANILEVHSTVPGTEFYGITL